jgi:hypothetical protein
LTFTLKLHGVVIGRSDLEHRNPEAGRAWGTFHSGIGYELVEPVFDLKRSDPSRYVKARDALALALYDDAGALVETSALDIEKGDGDRTDLVLRASILDVRFWR